MIVRDVACYPACQVRGSGSEWGASEYDTEYVTMLKPVYNSSTYPLPGLALGVYALAVVVVVVMVEWHS